MKLLVLTYHYAPDANPRAFRWTALTRYMAGLGHEVAVVAGWKPGQARREILDGVTVWRVGGSLVERLRRLMRASGPAAQTAGKAPTASWLSRLARSLYTTTWRRLYWPDHAALWIAPARRAASRLLRQGSFDALITVSHPFSSHWAGLKLKRERPGLRWLCDVGDPFAFFTEIPLNNHKLYAARNFRAEAQVLGQADAVAVTVESCRQSYIAHFPATESKLTVIPPLLSAPAVEASTPPAGRIRLVYSGTLYPGLRDPGYLFQIVMALLERGIDCELHLFGQLNDCERLIRSLPGHGRERIVVHGIVDRLLLARELAEASALVNIGNQTRHQLPSKLVEYVAAGRPILNLHTGSDDSSLAFLAHHPAALSIGITGQAPDEKAVNQVLAFLRAPPTVDPATTSAMIAPYRTDAIGNAYLALLQPESSRITQQ